MTTVNSGEERLYNVPRTRRIEDRLQTGVIGHNHQSCAQKWALNRNRLKLNWWPHWDEKFLTNCSVWSRAKVMDLTATRTDFDEWIIWMQVSLTKSTLTTHVRILTSTSFITKPSKTPHHPENTTFACFLLIWEWTLVSAGLFRHWCPNFGLKLPLAVVTQFRWIRGTMWNHSYWRKIITENAQQWWTMYNIYWYIHQSVDFGFFGHMRNTYHKPIQPKDDQQWQNTDVLTVRKSLAKRSRKTSTDFDHFGNSSETFWNRKGRASPALLHPLLGQVSCKAALGQTLSQGLPCPG